MCKRTIMKWEALQLFILIRASPAVIILSSLIILYNTIYPKYGEYFAKAMSGIGSMYFTKEAFDKLYPGYGSSYVNFYGGAGFLFEQGSSRGHVQETTTIPITFAFTIRNQFTAALTTIRASLAERENLYKLRKDFYTSAAETAKKSPILAGYVFGDPSDHTRTKGFLDLLLLHEVEVYANGTSITMGGQRFEKDHSLVAIGQTLLHHLQVGARHSLRGVGRNGLELRPRRFDPRRRSRGFLLGAQVGRQGHETGTEEEGDPEGVHEAVTWHSGAPGGGSGAAAAWRRAQTGPGGWQIWRVHRRRAGRRTRCRCPAGRLPHWGAPPGPCRTRYNASGQPASSLPWVNTSAESLAGSAGSYFKYGAAL